MGRKKQGLGENLVAILNLWPKKQGVTKRFLMVTVQNHEIQSLKPRCFQNNQKFLVQLFYNSSTSHNSVDTFYKGFLFFDIL